MAGNKDKVRLFTRAGNPMRIFLMNSAIFILIGIWLTGFGAVHWFIYVIPGIFIVSSIVGICPGINLWRIVLGEDRHSR